MFEELPKLPEDNPVLQSCPVRALFYVLQSCQSRPVITLCRTQTHPVTTQCVVDSFGDSVVYVANLFVLQTCQSCLVTTPCVVDSFGDSFVCVANLSKLTGDNTVCCRLVR